MSTKKLRKILEKSPKEYHYYLIQHYGADISGYNCWKKPIFIGKERYWINIY